MVESYSNRTSVYFQYLVQLLNRIKISPTNKLFYE